MSNQTKIRQDLPPSGGYQRITYERLPAKTMRPGLALAALALLVPAGIWDYRNRKANNIKHLLEDDEGRQALEPLLEAEQDRLLMWQVRRNRDEENELMKDVPGWVTGTWFGQPLYKTNPNLDTWVNPSYYEAFPHARRRDMSKHVYGNQWNL